MDEASSSHKKLLKGDQNTKFYILGGVAAFILVAPLVSYVFMTQRILDNSSSNSLQVANVEEEVIVTPIERIPSATPSSEAVSSPSAIPIGF